MGQYEDTLLDIEKTFGTVPEFMKLFPRESLIREWPLWKSGNLGEIDLERARYLLSEDELMEETLSQAEITDIRKFGRMARTVCCGTLVDAARAPMARAMTGERFLVCNDVCKRLIEKATPEELREIAAMEL